MIANNPVSQIYVNRQSTTKNWWTGNKTKSWLNIRITPLSHAHSLHHNCMQDIHVLKWQHLIKFNNSGIPQWQHSLTIEKGCKMAHVQEINYLSKLTTSLNIKLWRYGKWLRTEKNDVRYAKWDTFVTIRQQA